jgi:hypothetical protein
MRVADNENNSDLEDNIDYAENPKFQPGKISAS